MSHTLYHEAIAEAKELRDVAEKNAKNAIIEAVTPKIRRFIEDQLVSENDQSDNISNISGENDVLSDVVGEMFETSFSEDLMDDDVALDESALQALVALLDISSSGLISGAGSQETVEGAIKESIQGMNADERSKLIKIAYNLNQEAENLHHNVIPIDEAQHGQTQESSEMTDDTLYEVDLDQLARSLKDAVHEDQFKLDDLLSEARVAIELGDVEIDPSDLSVELLEEEEEDLDVDVEEEEEEGGEDFDLDIDVSEELPDDLEEEQLFEIDEKMLRKELRRMRSLAEAENAAAKMASSYGGGKVEKEPFVDMDDNDLNVHSESVKKLSSALKSEGRRNRALYGKLAEYRSAVSSLREQLTEMNLFNAKLLYVNKLLQNHSVSPKRRRSIIEALDKAASLREVKLLYRSLTEGLSSKSKTRLSESAVRKMGSASRPTSRASADNGKMAEVNRWAKLAGISE